MFKLIFIFLVVFGAVTTIRPVRDRVMPRLGHALEPVGERFVRPVKRWQARTAVENLRRALRQDQTQGRPLPAPVDFFAYAEHALRDDEGGTDPWGKRYWIQTNTGVLTIGSNGPDTTRNTPDDITLAVPPR